MKYLIIIIMTLNGLIAYSQVDRNVVWLHGLGDNAGSLTTHVTDIDERYRAAGLEVDYPSFYGVGPSTNNVIGDINTALGGDANNPNNIAIGHSMGGIVARDIDADNFGGIITIGSPNNGAMIANNLNNGEVADAIENACDNLAAGPLSEIPILGLVVAGWGEDVLCNVLMDRLVNDLLDDAGSPAANDLEVRGVTNEMTNTIPLASVVGLEDSPIHWNIASDVVGADVVGIAEDFRDVYNDFYNAHLAASIVSGIFGFFNPWAFVSAAVSGWQASQWKRGRNWLDRSEGVWSGLIGCGGDIREETIVIVEIYLPDDECSCLTDEQSEEWCYRAWELRCEQNPDDCWEIREETVFVITNRESDGFICEDSQRIGDEFEAEGVNHIEEMDDARVTIELRRIMDGGADAIFITPSR